MPETIIITSTVVFFGFLGLGLFFQAIMAFYCIMAYSRGYYPVSRNLAHPPNLRFFPETELWAAENGFRFAGFFQFHALQSAVWYKPEDSKFLILQLMHRPYYEFSTCFEEYLDLETSNNRDAAFLPIPPGKYIQVFPNLDLENLYERHLEAERFLISYGAILKPSGGNLEWPPEGIGAESQPNMAANRAYDNPALDSENPYEYIVPDETRDLSPAQRFVIDMMENAIRMLSLYIRSLPLWMLRTPFWYNIRRWRLSGKSLERLITARVYQLPYDLPIDYKRWNEV